MRFRKLRIAWSVLCGLAAVLLIALWLRSYWCADSLVISITKTYQLELQSVPGRCIGFIAYAPSRPIKGFARHSSAPPEGAAHTFQRHGVLGGDWPMQTAWIAHWLAATSCVLLGIAPAGAGSLIALTCPVLAFFWRRGIVCGMAAPFKVPGIEGLESEANEFYRILSEEKNDLACVLLSLGFLDLCLASLLQKFFIDGNTAKQLLQHNRALGTFSSRSDLAYCLGLIPKGVLQNLQALGEMRNSFAHTHLSFTFDDPAVKAYCDKLTLPKAVHKKVNASTGESTSDDQWPAYLVSTHRLRFVLIVSLIASNLMGAVFTAEKRTPKTGWVPGDVFTIGESF